MYSFCKDVFLVRGGLNSSFYDLNRNCLFHCSSDYADIAEKVITGSQACLTTNEIDKLRTLLQAGILFETDTAIYNGNIENLKRHISVDFAWVEVTNQCNMQCVHCYDEACAANKSYLSFDDFKYVVNELRDLGVNSIQLIGGEPLIIKNLKEMVKYASEEMASVAIFTNASLITEDLARFFKEYKVKIAISVYSYNECDHDAVTKVDGSYQKTIKGIKNLKKYSVKYRVANVRMNGINIGEKNTDLFELDNGDVVRLAGRANGELLNEALIRKKLITQQNFYSGIDKDFCSRSVSGNNCFSRRLYISANMDVFPCVMERRLCHGNLKNKKIGDILNADIINFNKDSVDTCRDCEFRYACFDCRPNTITGNIHEKPWYCTYNPFKGEWEKPEVAVQRILSELSNKQKEPQ